MVDIHFLLRPNVEANLGRILQEKGGGKFQTALVIIYAVYFCNYFCNDFTPLIYI